MQTTSSVVSLLLVCMSCIMVAEWCLVVGAKILKRHCKGFIKGFIEYTSTRKGKKGERTTKGSGICGRKGVEKGDKAILEPTRRSGHGAW